MEFKKPDQYKIGETIIRSDQIADRISTLGSQIAKDYKNKDLLLMPVLAGALTLSSDLLREIYRAGHRGHEVTFTQVKSYVGTESNGNPKIVFDNEQKLKGRNVLVVDDIIDTGTTLMHLDKKIRDQGAESVKTVVLLSKPEKREVKFEADYVGFTIPDIWVEGYGMDSDEYGRGNPDIVKGPTS